MFMKDNKSSKPLGTNLPVNKYKQYCYYCSYYYSVIKMHCSNKQCLIIKLVYYENLTLSKNNRLNFIMYYHQTVLKGSTQNVIVSHEL